jgi:general secretion pathway protein D
VLTRKLIALLVLVTLLAGCTAGRAFRRGRDAAQVGDWDAAVTHYQEALQASPDNATYKIELERAMQNAARDHIAKAREFEAKDQLDAALIEYRKAVQMDASNRLAAARASELERIIRERIEKSRPRPAIEKLREQARAQIPVLNPADRTPLKISFNNAGLKDILNFISQTTGINMQFDVAFRDLPYSVNLDGVSLEDALQQILSVNGYFYKVLNPSTIVIAQDNAQGHQKYDDLVLQTFYLSHAEPTELVQVLTALMRVQTQNPPVMFPNKTSNSISVRGTSAVVQVIERLIRANDKPRAEVIVDVQILEVNRRRLKQYGIDLNAYALNLIFSPEVAPPNTSATPGTPSPSPPPFNLNTITQGISTADFYLGVPTAVLRFIENDSNTRVLAKPQLRGAEGRPLTLNLGQEIPVVSTVFGAAVQGGFASIPQSSFTYRPVGVNMEMTPRVTYDGEIVLELSVENSALGVPIDVAGQSVPSFLSRKVTTKLRLREGESNLLAGLIAERDSKSISGIPGLIRVPGVNAIFGNNTRDTDSTDIVMLLTPHIVRTHELTVDDLAPVYIGTQSNVGLTGPPALIAPLPDEVPATPGAITTPPVVPGAPPPGLPRPPGAAPTGVPPAGPPAPPPGTTAVPTPVGPVTERPTFPPAPATPPGTVPPGIPPVAPPRDPTAPPVAPPTQPGAPAASVAQVILTLTQPELRVAGGPYLIPLSVNNASRLSTMTLTITYNPAVLRVRNVQDGLFMRQGGATATFQPKIDAVAGRVDIVVTRGGDQAGASGAGLIAALQFDAVGSGSSLIQVSGLATNPEGGAVPLQFTPVTASVR